MNTTHSTPTNVDAAIVATVVQDHHRLEFLPRHLGRRLIEVELTIYRHMGLLCAQYDGGYWDFLDLSNGGCYIAPRVDSFELTAQNGFKGKLSGDASGVVASLYAFSELAFKYRSEGIFAERFRQLREFALQHAEAAAILEAID